MARGYTGNGGYTGFGYWITWECGYCGASDDIQGETTDGNVIESIDHYCEADDD